jgi:hypothetical protein
MPPAVQKAAVQKAAVQKATVQKTALEKIPSNRAVACATCTRAAFFQARVEYPAGPEFIRRRANACSVHLVDVIQLLRGWARARRLASGGWLTVLAIDPYALLRLAAVGVADPGFVFYSAPITRFAEIAPSAEEHQHV